MEYNKSSDKNNQIPKKESRREKGKITADINEV